jgi:alpha-ketoglutarate-dependent 2,4-dichlorophenoxyacetate dioxygenase
MYDVKQIGTGFAREIAGIDASHPLPSEAIQAVQSAINLYAVVVLRGQKLDNESQGAFGRTFGELQVSPKAYKQGVEYRPESRGVIDISNLDAKNATRDRNDATRLENLSNRVWHSDASFRAVPGALSMLYAHKVPPSGGNTEFIDLRAAYDALPTSDKAVIETLQAEHNYAHSRTVLGIAAIAAEQKAALPPVAHPLVRTNPATGRKSLYMGAHASHIVGWPVPEGRILLADLLEHATQREFIYAHEWRVGDLVIWDNRCTLHRGRPFDESHPRDLRRVTTADTPTAAMAS